MHIFLVETTYQLINSLSLIKKENLSNILFILNSEHIKDLTIVNRLKEYDFVLDVYIIPFKLDCLENDLRAYKKGKNIFFSFALKNYLLKKIYKICRSVCPSIFYKNYFNYLYKIDLNQYKDDVISILGFNNIVYQDLIKCYKLDNITHYYVEDGLGSYVKKHIKKDNFNNEKIYFRRPDLVDKNLYINIEIKDLGLFDKEDKDMIDTLDYVFNYQDDKTNKIDNLILYYDQYEFEQCSSQELEEKREILNFINNYTQEKNLNIKYKLHPAEYKLAQDKYPFIDADHFINKQSFIPAELLELHSSSKIIYISFYSTATLSPILFYKNVSNVKCILLYKMFSEDLKANFCLLDKIESLVKSSKNFYIPNNLNELKELLEYNQ